MIGFLQEDPQAPAISPASEIDRSYRYWRLHIMFTMYVGYAVFYFTRKSYNAIVPELITDLGFEKSDIGLIGTLFYITYGASKFLSGMVSDHSNPRYFMGVGLIITGIINILFGISSSLWIFASLWMANAFFQGWGWPPVSKLLSTWYSKNERGMWWAIWNTSHNLGGALIPILVGIVTVYFGWRVGMVVPGLIGILVGVFLCWRLRDRPQSLGLPTVGRWRLDDQELAHEAIGRNLPRKTIIIRYVLKNKFLWLLACGYILIYIVRTAINDWGNLYLTEEKGYDLVAANSVVSLFEVGGFIGSLLAGWGSDKLFSGNRAPVNVIFSFGIFLSLLALWLIPTASYYVQATCFFSIGFFIFGPQMLIAMAAAEYSHKSTAGAATGFVSLFAYLGAALSGYPLAIIIEQWHWLGFFSTIAVASAMAGLLLIPFLWLNTHARPTADDER